MGSRDDSFGGRSGDVVGRAISPFALITGIALALLVGVSGWGLRKAGLEKLAPVAAAVIVAGFLARAAVDAWDARWSAGRGVPFADFVPVALRYLTLQAILVVPLAIVGWRPELLVPLIVRGPDQSPPVAGILIVALYAACFLLAPPLLLIVSVSASSFGDIVSPSHWGRALGGRGADVFLIYVLFCGSLMVVLLICIPVVWVVTLIEPRALTGAAIVCALFGSGTSINLLGQLCGECARELHPAEPKMRIIANVAPRPGATSPAAAMPSPAAGTPHEPAPAVPQTAGNVASPATAAPRKLPLLDGPRRVEEIVRAAVGNPAQAAEALEQLRHEFAPNASVLHALAVAYARSGKREEAIAVAREAIPLCARSGNVVLAAEIAAGFRENLDVLGVTPEQATGFAESLRTAKRLAPAAALYGSLLRMTTGNMRAMKGALQAAQDLAAAGDPQTALALFDQLMVAAEGTPLMEFVRDGRDAVMRKSGAAH